MHFSIRYLTDYRYDGVVSDNLNALRVRPATTPAQRCEEFQTRIDPEARVSRHLDYFGTEVLEFGVCSPHEQLTIDVSARVLTVGTPSPPDPSWASLASATYLEAAGEFVLPWQDRPALAELEDLEDAIGAERPLQALERLCRLIPERFEYRPGATYVGSGVPELLQLGGGVCQDFVHLSLVLLRRAGIAARYVSGYLWAAPADGGKDSLEVDTHAWLEALLPTEDGEAVWVSVDPTNGGLSDETHVKIGHGRFYADVLPVKGVYRGAASSQLTATVTMSRLDPATPAGQTDPKRSTPSSPRSLRPGSR
jgi:transglutaminase-like putative cysteine protease